MRMIALCLALAACKTNRCPDGGDVRAQCLVQSEVLARVDAMAPKRAELERKLATMLADHPFQCGSSSSDQHQHPSVQTVKRELAALVQAAGIDGAEVYIPCGQNRIQIAETTGMNGTLYGLVVNRAGQTVTWGGFGDTQPLPRGVVIDSTTPLPRGKLELRTFYRL